MKKWWSDKYHLPPTHHLFTDQTLADLRVEMLEDLYLRKSDLEAILEQDQPHRRRQEILEEYGAVCRALGEKDETTDPLVEQWERELAEGKTPDLEQT